MNTTYTFEAPIKSAGTTGGAYVCLPAKIAAQLGGKARLPVNATFDGIGYRGSLAKVGSDGLVIGVLKSIRKTFDKGPNDVLCVTIRKDTLPRIVEVPPITAAHLQKHPNARKAFENLAYTHQKEYVNWITEAKKDETRTRRMDEVIKMLLA